MLSTSIAKIAALGQGSNDFANSNRRNAFSKEAWEKLNSLARSESALAGALPILDIYKAIGLTDALWCLETIETQQGHDRDLILFSLALCRHYVEPHIDCQLTIAAINAAEQYAKGLASREAVHDALCKAEDANKKRKEGLLAADNASNSSDIDQLACNENALVIVWITERANFEQPNHRDPTKTGRAIAGYATSTLRKYAWSAEDGTPDKLMRALLELA